MKLELSRFLYWFGIALASAACAGHEGGDGLDREGGEQVTRATESWNVLGGTRQCEKDGAETADEYDHCFSKCWELAVTLPGYDCEGVCKDSWCNGCSSDSSQCGRYTYSFDTSSVSPIQGLEDACKAAVKRDKECGISSVADNCELVARVESEDTLETYNCVAETACADDVSTCFPSTPKPELRQAVCETVDDYCWAYHCTTEGNQLLDMVENWLSAEALEAAHGCLSETSCVNIRRCLDEWQYAVFAGSPHTDIFIIDAD